MTSKAATNHVAVPARQARAVAVTAGECVRVIDTKGRQVGDLFAFTRADPREYLSAAHTRAHVGRLFPAIGEEFVTNHRRPLLTLVDDTSPGRHDMLIAACDPARYRALGVSGWHASCAENLRSAASALGVDIEDTPQPVNLFMNIPVTDTGDLTWDPARTVPGDSVTLRAERDCFVVVSACPQDLIDINSGVPTCLEIEVSAEPTGQPWKKEGNPA
ncbi:urea carboxylase-associated family protein [Salinactinospora qingdaonensis]|uniref:Urea carboxylase-associated family protein n=1 Tax=Salinactinospora qingdaonensis TaxID=702744 RepID=A0ABP7FTW6_9ACTN